MNRSTFDDWFYSSLAIAAVSVPSIWIGWKIGTLSAKCIATRLGII